MHARLATVAGRLTAIGIVTRDMQESCRFYRTLGLDVPEPPAGEDHFEFEVPNGGVKLMWDTELLIKQIDPEWEEPRGHRVGLAFECESPADVDETYARLVAAGFRAKRPAWDAFWGQRYAQVYDPDGQPVDLYAAL
jgi:catechol 2,3-dioxygenase-like lactoylglutathione lyase family enzyme